VRAGFADALDLIPRVATAVGQLEELIGRVSRMLDRVDGLVDRADEAMDGLHATRIRADAAIDGVADTRAKADAAIDAVGGTTSRADSVVGRIEDTAGRVEPMLADYEPALTALAPSMRRLADSFDPTEVDALITLIDRLPQVLTHLDEDILPVLETLGSVGTDVHDLVDTVRDLRQIVKGFPGSKRFRRRGAEEIADYEAREAADS
jgi:ABC-type transporter Mla subunit MlaD